MGNILRVEHIPIHQKNRLQTIGSDGTALWHSLSENSEQRHQLRIHGYGYTQKKTRRG